MAGIVTAAVDQSVGAYQHAIAQWRAEHEAKLKAENGWLTVVGLHWLKEGENRVGSNPGFEVPLPKSAPERVGTITLKGGKARFRPAPGVPVTFNGKPGVETELKPDTDAEVRCPRHRTGAILHHQARGQAGRSRKR